jgi:hypothetical protein
VRDDRIALAVDDQKRDEGAPTSIRELLRDSWAAALSPVG